MDLAERIQVLNGDVANLEDRVEKLESELVEWIAYADNLERVLELVCGQSKDELVKIHAEQGLRSVRPGHQ